MLDHPIRAIGLVLIPIALVACADSVAGPEDSDTSEPPAPPALDQEISTGDAADRVRVLSELEGGGPGLIVCLTLTGDVTWWKGIGLNNEEPDLEAEGESASHCDVLPEPQLVTLTFWKAKTLGIHTKVGTNSIDLSEYAGHRITFLWEAD